MTKKKPPATEPEASTAMVAEPVNAADELRAASKALGASAALAAARRADAQLTINKAVKQNGAPLTAMPSGELDSLLRDAGTTHDAIRARLGRKAAVAERETLIQTLYDRANGAKQQADGSFASVQKLEGEALAARKAWATKKVEAQGLYDEIRLVRTEIEKLVKESPEDFE